MWEPEHKKGFRQFLNQFFSTEKFSKEEEKIWISRLSKYPPKVVASVIRDLYIRSEMRRAMPSLKSVVDNCYEKYSPPPSQPCPDPPTGMSWDQFKKAVQEGKIEIPQRTLDLLEESRWNIGSIIGIKK